MLPSDTLGKPKKGIKALPNHASPDQITNGTDYREEGATYMCLDFSFLDILRLSSTVLCF